MRRYILIILGFLSLTVNAKQSIYCPENHGTIKLGMTADEVLSVCGQPTSTHNARFNATRTVPVKQLIYTELNRGGPVPGFNDGFYNQWSLPGVGNDVELDVDTIDNKVVAIRINGDSANAATICQYGGFKVGDHVSKVTNACGSPSMINQTTTRVPIPSDSKPQIWKYKFDAYQSVISLTFVNSRLESID